MKTERAQQRGMMKRYKFTTTRKAGKGQTALTDKECLVAGGTVLSLTLECEAGSMDEALRACQAVALERGYEQGGIITGIFPFRYPFCSCLMENSDTYGCPNCHGEGLELH